MKSLIRLITRATSLLFVLALLSTPSLAQPLGDDDVAEGVEPTKEELAAARRLFGEAKALEKEGDWAGALAKLEKVVRVKMTPQVRFHVALCHEHLGRLVEAINGFELAVQEAKALGPKARAVVNHAPKRAEKLRARVAHVKLEVTGRIRTSKLLMDGRPLSLALIDTEIPVDPGRHLIEVQRDGEITDSFELELEEAQLELIELEIDDPEPTPDPDPEPDPKPVKPRPDSGPKEPPSRLPAYLTAGAGVALLGGAAVTFGLREATIGNVRCHDPENFTGCDPEDVETADLAETYDITSKVLVGVGAAAVATGVVLWFVLAPDDDPAPAVGASKIGVTPGAGGIQLIGMF